MRSLMLVLPYHAQDVPPENLQQLYTKAPMVKIMDNQKRPHPTSTVIIPTDNTHPAPFFRPIIHKSTTLGPVTAPPGLQRYPINTVEAFGLRDSVIPQKQLNMPGPFVTPLPEEKTLTTKIQKYKKTPTAQIQIAHRGKVDISSISITKPTQFTTKSPPKPPANIEEILSSIGMNKQKVYQAYLATKPTTTTSTTTTTTTTTPRPSTTTLMSDDLRHLLLDLGLITRPVANAIVDEPYVADLQIDPPYSLSVKDHGPLHFEGFKPLPNTLNKENVAPILEVFSIPSAKDEARASGSQKVVVTALPPVTEKVREPTTTTTTTTTTTLTPTPESISPKIDGSDFLKFKPLPTNNPKSITDEFQDILRSFGLLGGSNSDSTSNKARKSKKHHENITTEASVTRSTTKAVPIKKMPDMINIPLPSNMIAVLENLGVSTEEPMGIKFQIGSSSEVTTRRSPTVKKSFARNPAKPFEPKSTTVRSSLKPIIVGDIPMEKPKKINNRKTTSHIFNPVHTTETNKEDYQKLEHLLETIRELDKLNETLTEKHLEKLDLRNFNFSDSLLNQGPNPLLLYPENFSPLKNEVKRQEPENNNNDDDDDDIDEEKEEPFKISLDLNDTKDPKITVVNAVTGTEELTREGTTFSPLNQISEDQDDDINEDVEEKSTLTTTTEESRSASADELIDSFPNDTDPDKELDESLPPPRRNGFYFLADWNSFLEVGQDEEKVIIRFDPKVGDPNRFIPVQIPSKN